MTTNLNNTGHMCSEIAKILGTPVQSPVDTIKAVREFKELLDLANGVLVYTYFNSEQLLDLVKSLMAQPTDEWDR